MTTHDSAPTTDPDVDLPDMPDPQVREFPAHSIGGGLALLLGLVGLALGVGMIVGATAVSDGGAKAALIVPGVLIGLSSFIAMCGLNMVAPGEARVVQLFGRYRGTIRAGRAALGEPAHLAHEDLHPGPQPRNGRPQGQRRLRQPDRARRGRGVEGRGHRAGDASRWTTSSSSSPPRPRRPSGTSPSSTRTTPTTRTGSRCAATPRRSPRSWPSSCTRAWRRPASRSSSPASPTSRTLPRSPPRCSSGSRRGRSSPRGG